MWWVGDWWAHGDHAYGERAALTKEQAEKDGYVFQTWADAGWVARQIETSRRREVLSWSHHREVAPLRPDDQDELLAEAAKHGWSVRDLRRAVRRRKAERITTAWRSSVAGIIETGRQLIEAQDQLVKHGEWLGLVESDLPFGLRTAQTLMRISTDKRLAQHVAHLPPS